MDRFERQRRIPGWNQDRLQEACVAVCGRDWLGTLTTWALASIGVGEIEWVGAPHPSTEPMAQWFLAQPCPFHGSTIIDYPFDVEYGQELGWALDGKPPQVLLWCAERPVPAPAMKLDGFRQARLFAGTTAEGGWFGSERVRWAPGGQDAVVSLALAAILADAAREAICPVLGGRYPGSGNLELTAPRPEPGQSVLLVGAGGIGVYAALAAVLLGYRLHVVDFDRVEQSNLNRQGLFTAAEVERGALKSEAIRDSLLRLFPRAQVSAAVERVTGNFAGRIESLQPSLILSAVDNAATRLTLQDLGAELEIPVVQGGTDVLAADCYTQTAGGPLLDVQMRGALSKARAGEAAEVRRGSCSTEPSYVVPGMVAAGLMARRMAQLSGPAEEMPPLHWRSGCLPVEERSPSHDVDIVQLAS